MDLKFYRSVTRLNELGFGPDGMEESPVVVVVVVGRLAEAMPWRFEKSGMVSGNRFSRNFFSDDASTPDSSALFKRSSSASLPEIFRKIREINKWPKITKPSLFEFAWATDLNIKHGDRFNCAFFCNSSALFIQVICLSSYQQYPIRIRNKKWKTTFDIWSSECVKKPNFFYINLGFPICEFC